MSVADESVADDSVADDSVADECCWWAIIIMFLVRFIDKKRLIVIDKSFTTKAIKK